MYGLLIAALLISFASTGIINFENCGQQSLDGVSVDISGCSGDVCTIQRGSNVTFKLSFTAIVETNSAFIKVIAKVRKSHMTLFKREMCEFVGCPLAVGKIYTYEGSRKVEGVPTLENATIIATVNLDDGVNYCLKFFVSVCD